MPENTDSRGRHGFDREAVRMVKEPLVLLEHLALGRHSRIIKWSLAVLVIALVGLVMTRAFSAGDIFAVDMTQAVNISIQLFAIINPLVALPTFIFYTEGMQAYVHSPGGCGGKHDTRRAWRGGWHYNQAADSFV